MARKKKVAKKTTGVRGRPNATTEKLTQALYDLCENLKDAKLDNIATLYNFWQNRRDELLEQEDPEAGVPFMPILVEKLDEFFAATFKELALTGDKRELFDDCPWCGVEGTGLSFTSTGVAIRKAEGGSKVLVHARLQVTCRDCRISKTYERITMIEAAQQWNQRGIAKKPEQPVST